MSLLLPPLTTLSTRRIVRAWWPLALSWLMMAVEFPALAAIVNRMPNPIINLDAYVGIVFPLALIVESPIIMLLAASTALSKDWASYARVRGYMMWAGGVLTALHVLIAFTPLYYVVAVNILGAHADIVEPARIGLMIMTPWTWSIAYRRFNQGVLIRFDQSQAVGMGTVVRIGSNVTALFIGFALRTIPGIVVAASAVATGVVAEAIFIGWRVQPVLRGQLKAASPVTPALTFRHFIDFYIPLAMTSLILLLAQPIGSAALNRMPLALESLSVWGVMSGLMFLLRSPGVAYNEVVVALLEEPDSTRRLRRFMLILIAVLTTLIIIVTISPLSILWFEGLSALKPELADMARLGLWFVIPVPALSVIQSWYQGTILHSKQTRGVTESVAIYLLVSAIIFGVGVIAQAFSGLYVALTAVVVSNLAQTIWLWYRSRPAMKAVKARDAATSAAIERQKISPAVSGEQPLAPGRAADR